MWQKETAQARMFMLSPSLLLNRLETQSSKAKLLLPIMPIDIVTYAFSVLWDNLCQNSCKYKWEFQENEKCCWNPNPFLPSDMVVNL